ncbi:hydroxyacylglutathione hydrolase [Sphingomonas jejuensis]|uniref:Hydroxyacylglutathione hydrolase n=1 Tax=Sphingomonas jejuensis TaxID=904715 RepID=A0ABX0XQV5_9SPHN|nr:hydroxyacylglutathione hydrolase [Sphingomonas jejuensis]
MPLEVIPVPVLSDNYVWLVHDTDSGETLAVDPGEAAPVLAAADARGWTIGQIWNTHWHPDHVGGNAEVRSVTGAVVTGPAAEAARIPTLDRQVAPGDRLRLGAHEAVVLATPAHTAGHVSFHFPDDDLVFVGDTLFAMGCGRLFEGTAADMFAAMRTLEALGDRTCVYAGHEYTASNGRYARVAEPDNAAIRNRMEEVEALREAGVPTLPTTIGLERATNPFMRAPDAETLARHRAAKDDFRN